MIRLSAERGLPQSSLGLLRGSSLRARRFTAHSATRREVHYVYARAACGARRGRVGLLSNASILEKACRFTALHDTLHSLFAPATPTFPFRFSSAPLHPKPTQALRTLIIRPPLAPMHGRRCTNSTPAVGQPLHSLRVTYGLGQGQVGTLS